MRVLLFGGTTEGRKAALALKNAGDTVLVCVATEDGRSALEEGIDCRVGRLDAEGMIALAREFGAERIVDATHPFAKLVTENARACAAFLNLRYERRSRASDADADFSRAVLWADHAEAAAKLLSEGEGNILLTTGSNTVATYAAQIDPKRLYVRVLPNEASLKKCADAGIPVSHIMAMQGPFSEALNLALYRQWDIRQLVSKDSGDVGGVREKVLPALQLGLRVVLIRRPEQNGDI